MINKPAVALHKYTLDATSGADSLQVATSARELVAVLVTGGGGGITVAIHDSASGVGAPSEALYIAANAGESTSFTPSQTIPFTKGIYVTIEQGGDPFNGKVFLLIN